MAASLLDVLKLWTTRLSVGPHRALLLNAGSSQGTLGYSSSSETGIRSTDVRTLAGGVLIVAKYPFIA